MLRGERKGTYVNWESDQVSWRRGFERVAFEEVKERMEDAGHEQRSSLWEEEEEDPCGQHFTVYKTRLWASLLLVLTTALPGRC